MKKETPKLGSVVLSIFFYSRKIISFNKFECRPRTSAWKSWRNEGSVSVTATIYHVHVTWKPQWHVNLHLHAFFTRRNLS